LRKGEALERINQLFNQLPEDSALTWLEIGKQAGIPWSTVRNVLRREESGFTEGENGRWFRRAAKPAKELELN
jgi:hypothetical protein